MTSQPDQQTIAIDTLLNNTSQSKGNQTMKLGQFMECNTNETWPIYRI